MKKCFEGKTLSKNGKQKLRIYWDIMGMEIVTNCRRLRKRREHTIMWGNSTQD